MSEAAPAESAYRLIAPSTQVLSLASVRIELFCGEVSLGIGTGFFDVYNGDSYLITNWHCVTGRNPSNGMMKEVDGITPDRLVASSHRLVVNSQPLISGSGYDFFKSSEMHVPIEYRDGSNWLMHPLGQSVDVVAHKLQENEKSLASVFIRKVTNTQDAIVQVGSEVFILGFPKGLSPTGSLPIWKRGSIATEPSILADGEPCFWIDAATREGMSGSPVFVRRPGTYRFDNPDMTNIGKIGLSDHLAFCGIYSGRMGVSDALEAQIGKVWRPDCIKEVVTDGVPLDYVER